MSDMDLLEALDDLIINNKPDRDQKAIEALVLTANQESINYLRENDLELSLELLRKSEILLSQEYEKNGNEVIYKLIGLTLNNLGCYYKKTNKLKVAHRYLKKALEIETEAFDDKVNLASTNLNMCAILSSLKQHNEAIKHAKTALELLEAEKKNYSTEAGKEKEKKPEGKDGNEKYKSIVTTMIMAHFNYGIELEYVKDYNTSLETMKSGLDLAIAELGADNSLTKSIKKAIKKVSVKKKEADEKMQKREDYLSKQSEYTQTRRSESEEKPEVAVPVEKSTRTMSVHQVLYKHKSPRKPTKRYLEIAHDIKNIYSSESSNIILPAIKERPRKEVEPENREKIKASPEERRAKRVGKSPNNVNLPTLHKTVGGESSSIDSSNVVSPQRSAVATRKKKDGRTSPKNDPMRLESESGSLSIPVHKKLSEPLMQRKMESTGENSPAHLKSAVSQRSNMNGLMKSMVQSTRGGDLEAASRNDEESSNWNGSRLNTDNQSILKGYSSRSPQGGFVNDDAKRRVLKHKFFMSKANLAPVNIKKDLFNRNGEFVGRLPNTTKPGKADRETEK